MKIILLLNTVDLGSEDVPSAVRASLAEKRRLPVCPRDRCAINGSEPGRRPEFVFVGRVAHVHLMTQQVLVNIRNVRCRKFLVDIIPSLIIRCSDDSIYRNIDNIEFDIDISNRIESSKISNFSIYRVI